jgi:hypothetical protein
VTVQAKACRTWVCVVESTKAGVVQLVRIDGGELPAPARRIRMTSTTTPMIGTLRRLALRRHHSGASASGSPSRLGRVGRVGI